MEEEEKKSSGGGGKVRTLLEIATHSADSEVDPRLLKSIKFVVRSSDSELRIASETLLGFMKLPNSQVRYLALLIVDELFMRSKLFRILIEGSIDKLLSLSVGFRRNDPLPPPASIATIMRSKALELLQKWNDAFGIYYRQVRLGFEYLKNTLRLQFPNIQASAARIEERRRERELWTKEILLNKYEKLKEYLPSMKDGIQTTINEIVECLDILHSKGDLPKLPLDDEETEEIHSIELRQLRLQSLNEGEKIRENTDNKVVFDALRELYKLLVTRHLVSVQEQISVLVRVEVSDNRLRDSLLKEFIGIQNRIQNMKKKCEESGCSLSSTANQEEEDFWEEGHVERVQSDSHKILGNGVCGLSTFRTVNNISSKASSGAAETSESVKTKALNTTPVPGVSGHCDILDSEDGPKPESNQSNVSSAAIVSAGETSESTVQSKIQEENRVVIQPCRVPLWNGGLCPRRDLRVCPFHGKIIPRDDEGRPINKSPSTTETPSGSASSADEKPFELGSDIVEKLARQAVKNVRDRDAKTRENDEKSMKRAKLLKIREHNKAVLRDASMAASSSSSAFGGETERETASIRNTKKKTVASLLKKKVTVKDRLAQRLVNNRGKNSSVRKLTLGS